MARICKIEVVDFKNIKFHGLEPEHRRLLVKRLSFKDPKARYMPSVRLGRWDGTVSFCSTGGQTYLNFLPVLIPILEQNGYEFEIVDRRPDFNMKFETVDENFLADYKWQDGHPLAGQSIILHDHQVNSINKLLENDMGLLLASTSSGKCLGRDTILNLKFDFETDFGKFIKDLTGYTKPNQNVMIAGFFGIIERYIQDYHYNNEEVDVRNFGIQVETPSGYVPINYTIKKNSLQGIDMVFEDNIRLGCAENHILIQNGQNIFAKDVAIGDTIDTIHGPKELLERYPSLETNFYDIGIDAPHLYNDASGVIHHNTLITGALSKQVEKYGRSLVIVPNRDLVDQTYEDYKMLDLDVGRVYFGSRELDNQHVICTWQSLHSINKKKVNETLTSEEVERLLDGVVMTIQDEVHLATSKVIFDITARQFRNIPLCYGLTGTIPKEEHLRETLRANYGEVVYSIPAKELQEKGILSNCEIEINQFVLDKKTFGSYPAEKKFISNHAESLEIIASDVIEMSNTDKGNTLVLVENLEVGETLQTLIPDSVFLSGKDKSSSRKKEYKEVSKENNKVIIATYGIASTGISINRLFNVVLFNPGKSFTRTIQSIGRGLRIAQDKDFVHIKDYSYNTKYSSRHLSERKSYYKDQSYDFKIVKRKI